MHQQISTPLAKAGSAVLRDFDLLLEEMLALQRKEQALILARKTDELGATTQSIEWMGLRMQSMEVEVRKELGKTKGVADSPYQQITDKLGQIKRLAAQNHTLLEHSLFFLQQLFQQVMERDTPLHLYNANGHAFHSDLGGGLLETRI
jgi:flagellar biosynthesis/type III secretory pathway chaperone